MGQYLGPPPEMTTYQRGLYRVHVQKEIMSDEYSQQQQRWNDRDVVLLYSIKLTGVRSRKREIPPSGINIANFRSTPTKLAHLQHTGIQPLTEIRPMRRQRRHVLVQLIPHPIRHIGHVGSER